MCQFISFGNFQKLADTMLLFLQMIKKQVSFCDFNVGINYVVGLG